MLSPHFPDPTDPDERYIDSQIVNIRRGPKNKGRDSFIYCDLQTKDGELLISATLDYVVEQLVDRLPKKGD